MTKREEELAKALRELVGASRLGVKMLEMCGESKEADNLLGAMFTAEKVLAEPSRTREEILADAKNHTAYYEKVMESIDDLRKSFILCEKQWKEESYNSGLAVGRAEHVVENNKTMGNWQTQFLNEGTSLFCGDLSGLISIVTKIISAEIETAREDAFEEGLAQGRKEGYDVGYNKGREAGR